MYGTDYLQVPRTEWVLKWPGQVVIAGCQTFWTAEVSSTLEDGHLPDLYQNLLSQVRGTARRKGHQNNCVGVGKL